MSAQEAKDQARGAVGQVRGRAGNMVGQAREHTGGIMEKLRDHWHQLLAATLAFCLAGLMLAGGAAFALPLLSPLLMFFGPLLVPLGFLVFSASAAASLGCVATWGVASFGAWLYNYFQGRHPPGAQQVDYARARIHDTAEQVRHKARDIADTIQGKAVEAAPGA